MREREEGGEGGKGKRDSPYIRGVHSNPSGVLPLPLDGKGECLVLYISLAPTYHVPREGVFLSLNESNDDINNNSN